MPQGHLSARALGDTLPVLRAPWSRAQTEEGLAESDLPLGPSQPYQVEFYPVFVYLEKITGEVVGEQT